MLIVTLSKTTCYSITSRYVALWDNYYRGAYCKLLVPLCDLCSSYKQKSHYETLLVREHTANVSSLPGTCPQLRTGTSHHATIVYFGPTLSLGTGFTLSRTRRDASLQLVPAFRHWNSIVNMRCHDIRVSFWDQVRLEPETEVNM